MAKGSFSQTLSQTLTLTNQTGRDFDSVWLKLPLAITTAGVSDIEGLSVG